MCLQSPHDPLQKRDQLALGAPQLTAKPPEERRRLVTDFAVFRDRVLDGRLAVARVGHCIGNLGEHRTGDRGAPGIAEQLSRAPGGRQQNRTAPQLRARPDSALDPEPLQGRHDVGDLAGFPRGLGRDQRSHGLDPRQLTFNDRAVGRGLQPAHGGRAKGRGRAVCDQPEHPRKLQDRKCVRVHGRGARTITFVR